MSDEFKYEVAFSFLQDDETLALEIADRIRDRVSTSVFVYSERQDELVGNDGVDAFSRIFGEESRIVVVLYRQSWGETKWTRVEENAIRARGFNEGHEFVVPVKLDDKAAPVWLPPTRIYFSFERYGIDGLAGVLENRVREWGGKVRRESIPERAKAIGREIAFEDDRQAWRNSPRGVESALKEIVVLFDHLRHSAKEANTIGSSKVGIGFSQSSKDYAIVSGYSSRFSVIWAQTFSNTLERSGLTVVFSQGGESVGQHVLVEPTEISRVGYQLDWDKSRRIGWRERSDQKHFYTSQQLAETWIRRLLDRSREMALGSETWHWP